MEIRGTIKSKHADQIRLKFWLSKIISPVKKTNHKVRGKGTSERNWSEHR
jgi:hypothetical protein